MKKLPTIFPKDSKDLSKIIPGPFMLGINHFKLKIDGTACMIKEGKPYCRFDLKKFKRKKGKIIEVSEEELKSKLPEGSISCQEPDEKSGHWPHWIPVKDNNPSQKYILEGFNNLEIKIDGTYECIGPKFQKNPHKEEKHIWIPHFHENLKVNLDIDKLYNGNIAFNFFKELFKDFPFEGLVAYNENNEPIGKIRRSDFGYKNNGFKKASDIIKGE